METSKKLWGSWFEDRYEEFLKAFPPIMGGSGEGGEGEEGEGGSEGGEGPEGSEGEGEEGNEGGEGSGSQPTVEGLQAEIAKLRKENAKRRTDSKSAKAEKDALEAQIKAINKALGIDTGEDPDADAVKQLDKASAELKSLKIERAISRAAKKHGADAEALADSRSLMREADALDPDDDGFASELDSLVEAAVKNNPKLKSSPAPGKSGGEFGSPSGDGKKVSLDAAIAKGDKDAINKAMDAELKAGRK